MPFSIFKKFETSHKIKKNFTLLRLTFHISFFAKSSKISCSSHKFGKFSFSIRQNLVFSKFHVFRNNFRERFCENIHNKEKVFTCYPLLRHCEYTNEWMGFPLLTQLHRGKMFYIYLNQQELPPAQPGKWGGGGHKFKK